MHPEPAPLNKQLTNKNAASTALPEADFYDICNIAAEICHIPGTLVSIIDQQRKWFRSRHALITEASVIDFAFCKQAQHAPKEVFIISDLQKDHRFDTNPLVTSAPYLAFYAGVPLTSGDGSILGILCIWDNKPREPDAPLLKTLQSLGRQIGRQLELKITASQLTEKLEALKVAYTDLDSFANIAAHDLKGPLNAIISLTHLLKENYATSLDNEGNEYIRFLSDAANNLATLISGILSYSRSTQILAEKKEDVNFTAVVEEVTSLLSVPPGATIIYDKSGKHIHTFAITLKQILQNLLDNAIRFNDKKEKKVELTLDEMPGNYIIRVKDNGPGIPPEDKEIIFNLLKKLQSKTRSGKEMGTGLSIVKKLAEKMGGKIEEQSTEDGATFIVTLPK